MGGAFRLLVAAIGVYSCSGTSVADSAALQVQLQQRALRYFIEQHHPVTGLVRDKADNFADNSPSNVVASIAATGFGLVAIAHAGSVGTFPRDQAVAYATKVLRFARDGVPRHRGWFLHWIHWQTGERIWNSEYSPIDTALFIAGALYAGAALRDPQVKRLANQLYNEIDFSYFLTDDGTRPRKQTLSLSYTPERGFSMFQWNIYAEQKILLLLGLGHPSAPLPAGVWTSWNRSPSRIGGCQRHMGANMPLFVHQYSELFADFRSLDDGYPSYFDNTRTATLCSRVIAKRRAESFQTLRMGFWGYSAGESNGAYRVFNPRNGRSTVCIGCALGSIAWLPELILGDAGQWLTSPFSPRIWGRYGFVDSVDVDQDWASKRVLGITVGPIYMSIANLDSPSSIWSVFNEIPDIKLAFSRIRQRQ